MGFWPVPFTVLHLAVHSAFVQLVHKPLDAGTDHTDKKESAVDTRRLGSVAAHTNGPGSLDRESTVDALQDYVARDHRK